MSFSTSLKLSEDTTAMTYQTSILQASMSFCATGRCLPHPEKGMHRQQAAFRCGFNRYKISCAFAFRASTQLVDTSVLYKFYKPATEELLVTFLKD